MRTTFSTLALAALLAAPPALAADKAQAPAQASGGELTPLLILGAGSGYHAGFDNAWGVGVRYKMALAPRGVIGPNASNIRDEVDLEFGGDIVQSNYRFNLPPPNDFHYTWTAIRPRVGVLWAFWFTPQIALYPKLDLGYEFGWFSGFDAAGTPSWNTLFLEPSLGFVWQFKPSTSIRVEVGSEGLKLGIGFRI